MATVITLLHQRGPLLRSEITTATALNKSTVLSLVEELAELALVVESEAVSTGSRGRPSAMVNLNRDGFVAVVSEIAVDFARLAVIGLGGTVLQSIDVDVNPRQVGPRATAQALGEAGVDLLVAGTAIVAAATAIHGVVSPDGYLVTAPNLDWHELDLAALTSPFLPNEIPVFFGNDASLGALGEHRRGNAHDTPDLLYLSAERGIGGGLIRHGRLQSGAHGLGTEVGHFVVRRDGARCACGSRGCLETEIGEPALLRKANRRTDARRVVALARDGDAAAVAAVEDVAQWLGFAIGNFANLFDPGTVVLGGYLAEVLALAGDTIRTEANRFALATQVADTLRVVPSTLGRSAALVGAAELAFDTILQDPVALPPHRPTYPVRSIKESA